MVAQILALMEDSNHIAEVRICLEAAGYDVCIVDSFARAISIIREHSIDLIISDVHLENGGNVFDFLRWIRSHKGIRSIPFVLFSLEPNSLAKYLADGVSAAALHMGAAKYISMDRFDAALLTKEIVELCPSKVGSV